MDALTIYYRLPGQKELRKVTGKEAAEGVADQFVIRPFAGAAVSYDLLSQEVSDTADISIPAIEEVCEPIDKETDYLLYVAECLALIAAGELEKVVPARSAFFPSSSTSVMDAFIRLLQFSPNSFTYLLITTRFGCWMGASPELLLKQNEKQVESASLAGTRASGAAFGAKEINEQAIVTNFITNALVQAGGAIQSGNTPYKLQVYGMQHLHTRVKAAFLNSPSPFLLAETLHPTPALGGFPQKKAVEVILANESDRELYAGYLGFINQHTAELFVNIRCARIYANGVRLFAGAGVVRGSVPELELNETKQKMQTVGSAFGISVV